MSALTDLFSALANKIRTKTGGSDTYTPPEMVSAIDDVYDAGVAAGTPTLTGNASASDVLESKTFYNTSTTKQTGLMTNNGAVSQALDCGASYTVPAGYHNGSGIVTANSLASQTGVDSGKTAIDASHVFSGYQGWVNGSKVSGTYSEPVINSLTPSNSSPASMSANNNYKPTAAGYAISSYSSITPSSTSQSVSSGSIYKMGGNGVVVSSVPTINSITPSNSTPAAMSSGNNYSPTAAGYAISSYSSVTPSSSGASFSSGMVKMSGSGYAYSSRPASAPSIYNPDKQVHVSLAKNASTTVSVDQLPRYIIIHWAMYSGSNIIMGGNEYDVNANKKAGISWNGSSTVTGKDTTGAPDLITSVSSTSITVKNTSSSYSRHICLEIYY